MAQLVVYDPGDFLGTPRADQITVKTLVPSAIFGGGGDDTILGSPIAGRFILYGGIATPDPFGGGISLSNNFFGHPMPKISLSAMKALWANDGGDTFHVGDGWWIKPGGGDDDIELHPHPGGYINPAIGFGWNPQHEGDTVGFAHNRGFTVSGVVAEDIGPGMIRVKQAVLTGHDSSFLLDKEVFEFTGSDNRGIGVNPITGEGETYMEIHTLGRESDAHAVQRVLEAHDWALHHDDARYVDYHGTVPEFFWLT